MARSWDVVEKPRPTVEDRLGKTNGWLLGLWAVVLVLVGAVVAMMFGQAADYQRVKRLEHELDSAKAVAVLGQQATTLAQQAAARADSAQQLASVTKQRLAATNTKMMELASAQYAIEVRAERLDSSVTSVAAGLEELDRSVQKDFNFIADRIDSAQVIANTALEKAEVSTQSSTNLRGGFDGLRTSTTKEMNDLKRRQMVWNWLNLLTGGVANARRLK